MVDKNLQQLQLPCSCDRGDRKKRLQQSALTHSAAGEEKDPQHYCCGTSDWERTRARLAALELASRRASGNLISWYPNITGHQKTDSGILQRRNQTTKSLLYYMTSGSITGKANVGGIM